MALPMLDGHTDLVRHDPQGGRFHLLLGEPDWRQCLERDALDPSIGQGFVLEPSLSPSESSSFEFESATGSLRLAHREDVSRHIVASQIRTAEERRGSARDRYETWYWITDDRRGILRLAAGATAHETWWNLDELRAQCSQAQAATPPPGDFEPKPLPPSVEEDTVLAGLAITTGHFMIVGFADDRGGLFVFDLHGGGAPLMLRWPGEIAITPFDLAATAAGGVLVLDRFRRTWWQLDRTWRLTADVTSAEQPTFKPVDESEPEPWPAERIAPIGHVLTGTGADAVHNPISIVEAAGTVLVLDRPQFGPSAVVICDPTSPSGVRSRSAVTLRALDPTRPDLPAFDHDVVAQDFDWIDGDTTRPLPGPMLFVADASTASTEAFALDPEMGSLTHQTDELPMGAWQAKALVAAGNDVYYDAVDRWVPLEPFGTCNMERAATLRTPSADRTDPVEGQAFDSQVRGCTWHRLLIDADIPDGCDVHVRARAGDDPAVLVELPFVAQPSPYLRTAGSELPWHDPWSGTTRPPSPNTGTWELLFQHITGRYVQLELTLVGTGRSSPRIRALRAWYPRFSYVSEYLPEVYQEEDVPDHFLERLLANFEGMLTEHERAIENSWMLADPRTTPPEALDWLAAWVGLQLEPAWTVQRRRFLLEHVDHLYRMRGTIRGLRALLRVYLGCSLDPEVVFAAAARPDDPARLVDRVSDHHFRVLIPSRLDDDRKSMVGRIIEAARPAHASFELRVTTGLLITGEAQVGLDTILGESLRFEPMVIGSSELGTGVAGADHPFDITDRIVTDRDRLGELPPL